MNLANLLIQAAKTWPDRPALTSGINVRADFKSFADDVARLANAMLETYDLKPGDRIALAAKNCPEFCICLFAAWHAGLVAVPMNAKLHAREFAFILENCQAKLVFVTPDLEENISAKSVTIGSPKFSDLLKSPPAEMAKTSPDDLAWIFYTSGTTGFPKGAMLSHGNLWSMIESYFIDVDQISEQDCIIHAAPMSHGSGIYILPHIAKGACNVVPESGGFEPGEILTLLETYQGASFFFAPTMIKRLVAYENITKADLTGLKTIIYGGGPMYVEDCLEALKVLGPKLVQIYGQGEAPMTITALSRSDHQDNDNARYLDRLASVGKAQSVVDVQIVDNEGQTLGTGEMGEIAVAGNVVMQGYWQNPEASKSALRHGWLYTGDVGVIDDDGYVTLKDRSKDVIISGGSNIYPREVEEILLTHDNVEEVSVIGRPHEEWGEEVIAFIVAKPDTKLVIEELDALCLENIARFKRPKHYRQIEALPKNNYGKVLKTELRQLADRP